MKKKVYVATPVNGRQEPTRDEKRQAAYRRVVGLKAMLEIDHPDWDMVSSFDVCAPFGELSESVAMGRCVELLMTCEAIYLDRGWQSSKGCTVEHYVAKRYGLEIYEHDKM